MNSVDEDRYQEFDSYERVSKIDIQAIKNSIVFNMDGRQLLLTSIAIIVTAGILYLIHRAKGFSNPYLILIPLPIAIPILLFAHYKPLSLNLEDWLYIWYSNNIRSMPVRKLFSENDYERALKAAGQGGKRKERTRKPVQEKEAQVKEPKKNKGKKERKDRVLLVQ